MRRIFVPAATGIVLAFLVASDVHAQASISGLVQDATGAVLPGVTVEASSPALDREGAHRHDRRRRSLHDRRSASGHLYA